MAGVSWYKKEFFKQKGLYPNDPVIVRESDHAANLEGLMLRLQPGADGSYTLSANGAVMVNNLLQYIKFEKKGKFGEPFSNEYFHFTLHLKGGEIPDPEDEFCFRFNTMNTLTKSYLERQQIAPSGKNSDVIRLSIEGNEPAREIHYLNGLISEYINRNLEFRTETQKRTL